VPVIFVTSLQLKVSENYVSLNTTFASLLSSSANFATSWQKCKTIQTLKNN